MKISAQTKQLIIDKVIAQSYITSFIFDKRIIDFLNELIPLADMPSSDSRYTNAEDDAHQHLVNNDDWDIPFVFKERFDFLSNDTLFVNLINLIVNPVFCPNEDEMHQIVIQTNRFLEKEKYSYYVYDFTDNNVPIYKISPAKNESITPSYQPNKLPIYVISKPNHKFDFNNVHTLPPVFPSFNLVLNTGWNDYGLISAYQLFYFDEFTNEYPIGTVKIISEKIKIIEKNTTLDGIIPNSFNELDEDFCSLGQSFEYYKRLKEKTGSNLESILWAMKDCSFFPILLEKFDTHPYFGSSLIRNDSQEQVLREAKFRTYGLDPSNLYSFSYKFNPKFSKEFFEIELNFEKSKYYFNRIYGIIGKNGSGKTQFISSLPLDISKNNSEKFNPSTPLFSKVIAVSYSAFDNFIIPKSSANFNYVFCGLKNSSGVKLSERGLVNRFHSSWKKIKAKGRFSTWKKLLSNFIEEDHLEKMFIIGDLGEELSVSEFRNIRNILSSGQTLLLYIITEVIANIRYNSLILYDEPETHLHPNAISQLINTVFELLEEFDSYCIMTTHSPLIIRELISNNVYVFDREGSFFNVKQLPIETFGENLTTLTDEVFGNRVISNQYKLVLQEMSREYNYDQIVEILTSAKVPLSLNASIYLQNKLDEKA